MESGFIILIAIMALILGVFIGLFLGQKMAHRRYAQDIQYSQGTLNVDNIDPEFEPGLFLALGIPASDVMLKKYITLDVNVIAQDSHK